MFVSFQARKDRSRDGFTLIELLIVIGILGILMTTTLIAINPLRQISQAQNTKRKSDVVAILNALQQYITDHDGNLPVTIPVTSTPLSKTGVDVCSALTPVYVAGLPIDPDVAGDAVVSADECGTSYDTGYTIQKDPASNQITIEAPLAEYDEVISFSR